VMSECGLLMGGVLLILGVALGFTHFLIDAQVTDAAVEWATGAIKSPYTFLLAVNLLLIVVGCLMDIYSAIVVVVPSWCHRQRLRHPSAASRDHLPRQPRAGLPHPAGGMNLFLASYRFNKPMPEVIRASFP